MHSLPDLVSTLRHLAVPTVFGVSGVRRILIPAETVRITALDVVINTALNNAPSLMAKLHAPAVIKPDTSQLPVYGL